jgi:beta-galactosidase
VINFKKKGGVNMKRRFMFFYIFFLLFSLCRGENILKFGYFNKAVIQDGKMEGWYIPPQNKENIKIIEEDGDKFLRIENNDPERVINFGTHILLERDWGALVIKAKMRVKELKCGKEGWHNARIVISYTDEKGKILSYPSCPFLSSDTDKWVEKKVIITIREDAKKLGIQPGLYYSTGIFDISYIEIEPVKKGESIDGELPFSEKIYWGKEPIEKISETRQEIVLNGIWKFMPAIEEAFTRPTERGWGYIWVPGAYFAYNWSNLPGVISQGIGNQWISSGISDIGRVWYEREIYIPSDWQNSRVILKLDKVNTDAIVFLDRKKVGEIKWPYGEVEITEFVKPGEKHILDILVLASSQEISFDKLFEKKYLEKTSEVRVKGLTGNVILSKLPKGLYIDDLFIKTSVREGKLTLEIKLNNIEGFKNNKVDFICEIEEYKTGKIVKRFKEKGILLDKNNLIFSWKWENPKLWDYKSPNLYNLYLKIQKDGKIIDEYKDRFGFREVRIEGKKILLNEKIFNLRPILLYSEAYGLGGMREVIEGQFKGLIEANFNCLEAWPWDHYRRGNLHYRELWAEVADEIGLALLYPALSLESFYTRWNDQGIKEKWEKLMIAEWKRVKNHPSIIAWVCTANMFSHQDDQNPRRIGNSKNLLFGCPSPEKTRFGIIEEAMEIIRKYDNTRPIISHHSVIGDIHTSNNYLNLIPLQEREEWLSEWAKTGDKPFVSIEFGTPFYYTFLRGRDGCLMAPSSEPLMTEYCAIYLGEDAYKLETQEYRDAIKKKFKGGQEYEWWQGDPRLTYLPSHLKLQSLFIKNTWRSWRAYGWNGGIPWEWNVWAWKGVHKGSHKMPDFTPGRRYLYMKEQSITNLLGLQEGGWEITEAGMALKEANSPTLMYIGGNSESFTEKGHHFYSESKIEKQVIIINDEREPQYYRYEVYAEVKGKKIFEKKGSGKIDVGEVKFELFSFKLPKTKEKTDGKIVLTGVIGERRHQDEFNFRIYPILPKEEKEILIYDPLGETSRFLSSLGYTLEKWNGEIKEQKILIIGKNGLIGNENMIDKIKEFVERGGKVLICGHHPDWLRNKLNLRVARHVSRRVFPVKTQINHPIIKGLDKEDFRDWNGEGNLVEKEANTSLTWKNKEDLYYGYHWGNRGSVTSAPIEKPHFGSWKPILECEFDLAYSPLMEIDYGKGILVLSTLDIEGREKIEPVAEIVIKRIIDYLENYEPKERVRTYYIGDEKINEWLNSIGLIYEKPKEEIKEKCLLIVGKNQDEEIKKHINNVLEKGGNVLLLGFEGEKLPFDIKGTFKINFAGSLDIPEWEELKGISVSDLHFRSGIDLWMIEKGKVEIAADGLIARYKNGKGKLIFFQIIPDKLNCQEKTYFRFTSWRITHAISIIIANLGGRFDSDELFFKPDKMSSYIINLSGAWKYRIERKGIGIDLNNPLIDEGNKGEELGWHKKEFNDNEWEEMKLPQYWETVGGEMKDLDGAVWFRKKVIIPDSWIGKDLFLSLGPIDDFDTTYFNGIKIGTIGKETPNFWAVNREYKISKELVTSKENIIAVRVFDHYGSGGFGGTKSDMFLKLLEIQKKNIGFYINDYRTDHARGDDPYRYHRW